MPEGLRRRKKREGIVFPKESLYCARLEAEEAVAKLR